MIGSAADDAGAKPLKIVAGSGGIRLALNVPCAIGRKKFTEIFRGMAANTCTAVRQVVGPHEHLEIFFRVNVGPSLEHGAVEAALGEDFCSDPSTGTGANDADIVLFGRTGYLSHV